MNNILIEKLNGKLARYTQIQDELMKEETYRDVEMLKRLKLEESALASAATGYMQYKELKEKLAELDRMVGEYEGDDELKELIALEARELEEKCTQMEDELAALLRKESGAQGNSVFIEIRAGAGGEEAALFGALVLRMYMRYAERKNYRFAIISENRTEMGGIKECVLNLKGDGVYLNLKNESGVHRVQRVPETESSGRIHTSAATVAVMKEANDVEVSISDSDIRIDTYRSSGAGGQHVNKTESAIRITHIPTGIVVQCQDEKSQLKNKEQAMRVLKARLFEHYRREKLEAEAKERREQVGSGDRSERIRTYNFHEGRVTDHRINLTLYKLNAFLDGDMDEILVKLHDIE